jgi:hypothetical protein
LEEESRPIIDDGYGGDLIWHWDSASLTLTLVNTRSKELGFYSSFCISLFIACRLREADLLFGDLGERETGEIDVTKHRLVTGVMIFYGKRKKEALHSVSNCFSFLGHGKRMPHVAPTGGVLSHLRFLLDDRQILYVSGQANLSRSIDDGIYELSTNIVWAAH